MPDNGLPRGWRSVRLGDVADIRRDLFDPTKAAGLAYVALEHIEQGSPRLNGSATSEATLSPKTRFRAGDTLFGKLRPHLRKAVRAPFDGVCSTDILALYPKDGLQGEYLAQLTYAPNLQDYAITTSIGTKMPRTSWPALAKYRLPLPPPDEQRRIAEVLDAIDAAIEKTEAVIAATERLRSALLGELLTRGVPGWHTEWKQVPGIGTIPACWEVVRLGEVVGVNQRSWDPGRGGRISYVDIGAVVETGVVPTPKDIDARDAPSRARRIVRSGDILVSTVRPYLRAFVRIEDAPAKMVASTGFAVLTPDNPADSNFVYYQVLTPRFVKHLEPRMTGTGYPAVRPEDVADFPIGIPEAQEREVIGRTLAGLDARIAGEVEALKAVTTAKSAVAAALLSGRVRVTAGA